MSNRWQANVSLSAKEEIVLEALRQGARPRTAYELIEQLRDKGISAPPTIYRALNRLIALGHAHRLETLNAYIACQQGHCSKQGKPAFAICDECGHVEEIEQPVVASGIESWVQDSQFTVNTITLELHGNCRSCRDTRASKEHNE